MTYSSPQKHPQSFTVKQITREPIDKSPLRKPVGRVFIVPERCKECKYCSEYCPEEVLEISQAVNSQGYHYPQVKQGKESACIVCGMCEWICPDFAIYAVKARTVSRIASKIRTIRWASQLGFLGLFLLLITGTVCTAILGGGYVVSEPLGVLQLIFAQALPTMSFSFITATVIIGAAIFVGVTVLVGRAFCAWACPMGTIIDAIDTGLEKLKFRPFFTRNPARREDAASTGLIRNGMGKYGVLASVLAGSAFLKFPVWCAFCPIGTLCRGAVAGAELAVGAEILSVPAVGALSLGEKRFWCKHLCPVGGLLTVLSKYNLFIKPRMRGTRHPNCGLCTTICPEGINLCQEKSYARCTKCLECYAKCPSGVVKIDAMGMHK